jgi:FtsH-binding integral membrane protein
MLPSILFGAASLLSLAWFFVHLFFGGKDVARPLLVDEELPEMARQVLYVCWHFVSATIAVMAILFALAVLLNNPSYAVGGTLLAAGFALVGIAIGPLRGWRYSTIPQGWLFVPIAAMGAAGLLV